MNPNQEELLFGVALTKPLSERAAWLAQECGDNKALHVRLEALLAAHEQPEALLATRASPAVAVRNLDLTLGADESVGQTLGHYKLLEKLGEGGCGVVYVAEQTEPVRRRVALKVIKLGMDTKAVVARFGAERQALALMDHPNIARVLDAGTTEQERPFFVMELVHGIRITDYCDQNQLSTKERLDLFTKVCHAIQHAHQKGIIHRDIKPSNIMVTLHDGVPVPKVIDFGIAKATEGRLTDSTVYTQLHQFIGTPAYMSPEQAEMSGIDIDTRSDIYSLGVLLYEMLTGKTPFDARELMSMGLDAMRKTIREQEPARPSTKVATLAGEELTKAAMRRSTKTVRLVHELRGDLDWIVMKCLEKDRTRRYPTANGLAADLDRYLNNEPVTARPPSAAYKLQKAIRRNKLAYAAGMAIFLALAAGVGVSSALYFKSARLVDVLRSERMDRFFDEAMSAALGGHPARMAEAIRKAEGVGVQDYKLLLVKGWHALSVGEVREAIHILTRAHELNPKSVAVLSLLASAYVTENQWSEYDRRLRQVDRLQPVTPEDHLFKGIMVAQDDPVRGLDSIDEAIRLNPSPVALLMRAEARATRAQFTLSTNDAAGALADLESAKALLAASLGLAMTEAWAYGVAAMVHQQAGAGQEVQLFTTAADRASARLGELSQAPQALLQRAMVLELTGRDDEQFQFLREAVEHRYQRHPIILVRYAIALCLHGHFDRALEVLDPACPNDSFMDTVRMLALLASPARRSEFDAAFEDYLGRYDGVGDQLFGLWVPLFAGRTERAFDLGRRFHQKPPAGFDLKPENYHRASRFLAGLWSDQEYLQTAGHQYSFNHEAHFLIGSRRAGEGRRVEAMEHLRQAIRAPLPWFYTHEFARIMLAILEREPDWPPTLEASEAAQKSSLTTR